MLALLTRARCSDLLDLRIDPRRGARTHPWGDYRLPRSAEMEGIKLTVEPTPAELVEIAV